MKFEASVDIAGKLYMQAGSNYMDVLFAQRDLMDARMVLIDTKREQLSAIVNTYQALGGGLVRSAPAGMVGPIESPDDGRVVPPAPEEE